MKTTFPQKPPWVFSFTRSDISVRSTAAIDTPGQASAVYCNGVPPSALAPAEQNYVLLQGPTVSTPDWSNGLDPLGTIIKSGLDINYDDMVQQVLTDSPDWYSLNLQQVGARAGSNGDSADLGKGDLGKGDLGKGDLGKGDLGKGDLGTAALGQDALGDQDFAAYALSGLGLTPPTGLSVTTTTTPPAPAQYPGASGNVVSWVAPSVVTYYNVYRCNASITPGCTPNVRIATDVLVLNYTDPVSDYMDAPTNLNCNTQTCYNTNYIYDVTAVFVASGLSTESAASNTGTSTVPHQFVTGTIASTSLVYGAESQTSPNAITVNIVGNGTLASVTSPPSSTPTGTQAYCVYTATAGPWSQLAPPTAVIPRNVGTYYIFCTGPATVSTTGVTYNVTNLTYTPPALSSTLTITQAALTITAAPETKTFDGTNTAPVLPLPNPQPVFTGLQYNDTVTGVAEVYTETPPNAGTGLTLSISAYTVNDGNSGGNYNVTTKLSTATGVINKATPTVTATGATCTFNGSPCPAASDSATGVENPVDTLTPVTLSYSGTSNSGAAYGPSATAPTNAGNYTVTASYAGNINYIAGTSMPVAITINKATPTVTATGNTCTFSGLPCAGSGTATGVLTPTDVLIPSVTLSYSGTGVTVYGPNAAAPSGGGSYTVTASFAGNANYLAGTSAPAVITINPATPTVTAAGNTCTFSGSTCPGGGLATGVLSGPDVLTPLGLTYVGAGVTAYGPTAVPPTGGGSYTVTASFGGNANYKAGSSLPAIITINPATPTVTATGNTCTYNGTPCPGSGSATGVLSGPDVLTPVTLSYSGTSNSNAAYGPSATAPTYAGNYTVTASFAGNANYIAGTSTPATITINQAAPTVTDNGPPPPPDYYGQPVTLTVTVAPTASGEVPTGTVTFSFTVGQTPYYICQGGNISTTSCTVPLSQSSPYVASVTTSTLPTAAENVVATYSGDPNFLGETANPQPVSVTVTQASSAVTLTKSTDPTTYGTPVNLTVNVADATGGSIGVPTGTVTLSFVLDPTVPNGQVYYICADGTVITAPCAAANQITLATDQSIANTATVTVPTSALPAGLATFANPGGNPPAAFSYPITATYSGDTNFAAGAPFGLSQTVNPAPVTATAGSYSGTYNGMTQSLSGCTVTPTPTNPPSTFVGTVTCTNNLTTPVGPNAGSGSVTPVPAVGAGDSLNNYAMTLVDSSWNIYQAPVTVNLLNMMQTYTGGPLSPTASTTPPGITTSLTGGSYVNAGGYPVSAAVTNPNYTGSASGTFHNQPVPIDSYRDRRQ